MLIKARCEMLAGYAGEQNSFVQSYGAVIAAESFRQEAPIALHELRASDLDQQAPDRLSVQLSCASPIRAHLHSVLSLPERNPDLLSDMTPGSEVEVTTLNLWKRPYDDVPISGNGSSGIARLAPSRSLRRRTLPCGL